MRTARSAGVLCTLGATLTALVAPGHALSEFADTEALVAGISTGNTQGISTGNIQGISTGNVLSGPVDSIDRVNGVFTSMGQTVLASQSALRGMSVGDFVSVRGSVVGGGWLYADAVEISADAYVPGATPVMLAGIPSQFDRSFGTAQVGNLTIDYTAALSRGDVPGDSILVFEGIQPAKGGMMISDIVLTTK